MRRGPGFFGSLKAAQRLARRLAAFFALCAIVSASHAAMMTAEETLPLYRAALGAEFQDEALPSLYAQHLLVERYFAATNAADRLVAMNELARLTPNLDQLGKILGIRLTWQALTPGVYYINEPAGTYTARFFLGVPQSYDRAKLWPLVVKLPTPAAFLTDPPPDADAVTRIYSGWISEELAAHPDAVVAMPLLNLTELYGPSYEGMNSVMQAIFASANKVDVDPGRVYLIGHSMASHAAWNVALHYPTYFASFMPLAGGAGADWQGLRLPELRNVYPVVWHDADDQVIPVKESRDLVESLRRLKIDVDYTETHGLGHGPPLQVQADLYQKMRARQRELYPAHLTTQGNRPDSLFNRNDWVQMYQPIDGGPEQVIHLQRGTGSIRTTKNAWTLDAIADHNTINLTTTNVDAIRLYFNPTQFDLTQPITVNINRKSRFNGLVKPSLEEMLKDQLFLGRGWRYYTAVLDLDVFIDPNARGAGSPTTMPASRPKGRIQIIGADGKRVDVNIPARSGAAGEGQ